MTSLTESPCAFAAGQWTFSAPPAPAILPTGNYTITHTGYPGKCLTVDAKSNVVMSADNCKSSVWYFTSATDAKGRAFYLINYIPNGLSTPNRTMLTLVSDSPSDCSSATQLMYSNDSTSGATAQIVLGNNPSSSGNTIYDAYCKQFFVPNDSNIGVAWDANDPKIGQWVIKPVACATPTPQPSGSYILSFQDAQNVTQYLSYTLKDPSRGDFLSFTPTFSLTTCVWNYDAAAKTLSTGCASAMYYLTQSTTFSAAILTTDVKQARNDVVLTSNSVFLKTYQALAPSNDAVKSIDIYSCLSSRAVWTVTPLNTGPPPSMESGTYAIKYADKCLFVNGSNQVVLDKCVDAPTLWVYNKDNKTLSALGQCLTNNSAACASLQNLVMGPCGGSNTKRFVLGTNGKIYDPVFGMCYTPTGAVNLQNMKKATSMSSSTTYTWIFLGVVASLTILGIIWWGKSRKKTRINYSGSPLSTGRLQ
jgi:hypothetical protein